MTNMPEDQIETTSAGTSAGKKRQRNPAATRQRLLDAAAHEVHRQGFRNSGLDAILSQAGVTKGALYHHFGSKQGLGYAVLDEVYVPMLERLWITPLQASGDPLDAIAASIASAQAHFCAPNYGCLDGPANGLESSPESTEKWLHGCPLDNLAHEMADLDEGFHERISGLFDRWRRALEDHLEGAQELGELRSDVVCASAAAFIVSACQGAVALAKGCQCRDTLGSCLRELNRYLESLRPSHVHTNAGCPTCEAIPQGE